MRFSVAFAVVILGCLSATTPSQAEEPSEKARRNIILFIADGMGYAHTDIGSIYAHGEPRKQVYWDFLHLPMSTHSANNQQGYDTELAWGDFKYFHRVPTDSAAAATTLATGIKTKNGAIGVGPEGEKLHTIIHDAEARGMATGIVSSVRFTHATPASFGAHVRSRGMGEEIARAMIHESPVELIASPAHPYYDNDGKRQDEPDYDRFGGKETWEALVGAKTGGDADGDGKADAWHFTEALDFGQSNAKRVFVALPVYPTLQAERVQDHAMAPAYEVPFTPNIPTLSQIVETSLQYLDRKEQGFFVMIEGGAVDWASHANRPGRLVEEQIDFDQAVAAAVQWVEAHSSWEETLIIVTSDHECGYVTGPDSDPEWTPIVNNGKGEMPGFEFHSTSHTNQLVPLFARGVGAERFQGRIHGTDKRLGDFTDNAEVYSVMKAVLEE